MAEYRDCEAEIRAAGAKLAAISVDDAEKSQSVRKTLHLNFPILSDVHRRVVREWGVYNAREKGGIARPAVFIVDSGRVVRFVSADEVASRVSAAEIVRLLSAREVKPQLRRRKVIPRPGDFWRATSNSLHFGVKQPDLESK